MPNPYDGPRGVYPGAQPAPQQPAYGYGAGWSQPQAPAAPSSELNEGYSGESQFGNGVTPSSSYASPASIVPPAQPAPYTMAPNPFGAPSGPPPNPNAVPRVGDGNGYAPQAWSGVPTGDWNMSSPQADEQFGQAIAKLLMDQQTMGRMWAQQNPNAFTGPGAGEQYWNQVAGNFNGGPAVTNLSEQAYGNFQNQRNELGALPGLDPYYERARERTAGDLNRQLAARGGYNSSRGLNVLSDAMQGLNAEQANREADYALNRSQNALNWATGGSQAARMADSSSLGQAQADLARTLGFGDLAMGAQNAEQNRLLTDLGVAMGLDAQQLSRLGGSLDAASVAGGGRRERIMDMFNSLFGAGGAVAGTAGAGYNQLFDELMALEDGAQSASLGGPTFTTMNEAAGRGETAAGLGSLAEIVGLKPPTGGK